MNITEFQPYSYRENVVSLKTKAGSFLQGLESVMLEKSGDV